MTSRADLTGVKNGTRILLVEDNAENVTRIRGYFDNLDVFLELATSRPETIEKCENNDYGVVLLNMQMDGLDGYAATREIRAWEKANSVERVPIVALIGSSEIDSADKSIEAGCDGVLKMPVERNDLVEAIGKFSSQHIDIEDEAISEEILARQPAFLSKRWQDLASMREALSDQNFETLRKIAHNCKGIGTGYGFPEISRLGKAIETAAKELNSENAAQFLGEFEQCLQAATKNTPG